MISIKLPLKVIPGASREAVLWFAESLKVKVTIAPEKGQANRAVEALLARRFGLSPAAVTIVAGHSSQQKQVELIGVTLSTIRQTLEQS